MTNKLTKKAKDEIKKEVDPEYEILQKINVTEPTEADKQAYYNLKKENPEILERVITLTQINKDVILSQNCSFLVKEKVRADLKKMRDALGWETAPELERLLIEQICINWLRVTLLEKTHAVKTFESHSTETGLYWDKRLTSAQRRYLRACETLAKVRKLLADAELKVEQARNKRSKSTLLTNQLLKELTDSK